MREKNIEKVAPSSKTFFKNGMNGHSAVRCITDSLLSGEILP